MPICAYLTRKMQDIAYFLEKIMLNFAKLKLAVVFGKVTISVHVLKQIFKPAGRDT